MTETTRRKTLVPMSCGECGGQVFALYRTDGPGGMSNGGTYWGLSVVCQQCADVTEIVPEPATLRIATEGCLVVMPDAEVVEEAKPIRTLEEAAKASRLYYDYGTAGKAQD